MLDKQQTKNDKIEKAQQKNVENIQLVRQKTLMSMKKWDHFRAEKEKYVDFTEKLLKDRVRIRTLNAIIQVKFILKALVANYDVWKERNKLQCVNCFLAFKFKIRFYVKFKRKYGQVQPIRYQRYVQRHLTLYGRCSIDAKTKLSKQILLNFIMKRHLITSCVDRVIDTINQCFLIQK